MHEGRVRGPKGLADSVDSLSSPSPKEFLDMTARRMRVPIRTRTKMHGRIMRSIGE
jgi:hypothetical protein